MNKTDEWLSVIVFWRLIALLPLHLKINE